MIPQLYIVAVLYVLVPIASLVMLRRWKAYHFSAILAGVAAYLITTELLLPMVNAVFTANGLDSAFWDSHVFLDQLLTTLLTVVFMDLCLYLIMRFAMKRHLTLYDAMAAGISYYFGDAVTQAAYAIYSARLLQYESAGTLSSIVSENVTLESLEKSLQSIHKSGVSVYYIQLFALVVMVFIAMTACMYLYFAIKKPAGKLVPLCMLVHEALLLFAQLAVTYLGIWWYLGSCVVCLLVAVLLFRHVLGQYRRQQIELARKLKAYKQHLKEPTPPES